MAVNRPVVRRNHAFGKPDHPLGSHVAARILTETDVIQRVYSIVERLPRFDNKLLVPRFVVGMGKLIRTSGPLASQNFDIRILLPSPYTIYTAWHSGKHAWILLYDGQLVQT